MRIARLTVFIAALAALMLAGCGHKLVAAQGEHTVAVYPDKLSFERVESMKKQGGPVGMLGGWGQSLVAKQVDSDTPVQILSTDPEGAQIEVLDGPSKGLKGFVAKENVK
jgi:hypothetical protein